jgi:hypothetical protein
MLERFVHCFDNSLLVLMIQFWQWESLTRCGFFFLLVYLNSEYDRKSLVQTNRAFCFRSSSICENTLDSQISDRKRFNTWNIFSWVHEWLMQLFSSIEQTIFTRLIKQKTSMGERATKLSRKKILMSFGIINLLINRFSFVTDLFGISISLASVSFFCFFFQ